MWYIRPEPCAPAVFLCLRRWKFRFRREADADTGLGGVPLFQTF
jgi:hypothetical protein